MTKAPSKADEEELDYSFLNSEIYDTPVVAPGTQSKRRITHGKKHHRAMNKKFRLNESLGEDQMPKVKGERSQLV